MSLEKCITIGVQQLRSTLQPCPVRPPTSITTPTARPEPIYDPPACPCPLVNCLQGPGLCDCINTAAQRCHARCGGSPPKLQQCPTEELDSGSKDQADATCECESVFCIQSYPEGCYCANSAAQACHTKCGGPAPQLKVCTLDLCISRMKSV
jgi:hypothetical protein